MKRWLRTVTVLCAVVPLSACARGVQEHATTLRVFVQPFLSHAPLLVADAEGYLAEQGIRVEFLRLHDPAAAIPMLVNGELDVLPGGASAGLLNAMTRGLPVRAVAGKGYFRTGGCSRGGMVLRTALAREGAAGLERVRRISIDRQPQQHYVVEKMLASVGLQLQDLEVLYIPHLPEIEALSKGTLDAALAGDPFLSTIIERGVAVRWISEEDVLPDAQFSFLFFGPTLLQKDRDVGRRFLVAYLKAVRQLEEGKTERNLAVLGRVTQEGTDALQRMCWPSYHSDGRFGLQDIADFQAWALKRKLIDRVATAEEFSESGLLAQANAALAQEAKDQ
jgi:NitT/TauT family transport system substrate-binding protein